MCVRAKGRDSQKTEALIAVNVINRMMALGVDSSGRRNTSPARSCDGIKEAKTEV